MYLQTIWHENDLSGKTPAIQIFTGLPHGVGEVMTAYNALKLLIQMSSPELVFAVKYFSHAHSEIDFIQGSKGVQGGEASLRYGISVRF